MATYGDYMTINMQAYGDLSSYQYYLVERYSTAEQVTRATTGSNTWPLGVLYNDPDATGEAALVAYAGEVVCRACADSITLQGVSAGGAITVQSRLAWDTLGQAVKAPTSACAHCIAEAMEALASGSGNIRVLLRPGIFNTNS
jgi:hypothetical protein